MKYEICLDDTNPQLHALNHLFEAQEEQIQETHKWSSSLPLSGFTIIFFDIVQLFCDWYIW